MPTARGVMANSSAKSDGVRYAMPRMGINVVGTAPKKPNVYSVGSLQNTKAYFRWWVEQGCGGQIVI